MRGNCDGNGVIKVKFKKSGKLLSATLFLSCLTEAMLLLTVLFNASSLSGLREISAIAAMLLFVLIILQIIYCLCIFRVKRKSASEKKAGSNLLVFSFCVSSLILVFLFLLVSNHHTKTFYVTEINKECKDNVYYIVVNNENVRITEQQFDSIIAGEAYMVQYYTNDLIHYSKAFLIEKDNTKTVN